jgi:hypothetical protein
MTMSLISSMKMSSFEKSLESERYSIPSSMMTPPPLAFRKEAILILRRESWLAGRESSLAMSLNQTDWNSLEPHMPLTMSGWYLETHNMS